MSIAWNLAFQVVMLMDNPGVAFKFIQMARRLLSLVAFCVGA